MQDVLNNEDTQFIWLVVTGTWLLFSHILEMSSSQLTFIFFRGVAQPPTSYDYNKLVEHVYKLL